MTSIREKKISAKVWLIHAEQILNTYFIVLRENNVKIFENFFKNFILKIGQILPHPFIWRTVKS